MKKRYHIVYIAVFIQALCSCNKNSGELSFQAKDAAYPVNAMTTVMVHDITNPPLASRFFAYAAIAGYEVVSQNNTSLINLKTVLAEYPLIPKPAIQNYSYQAAAVFAIFEVASRMQPSGYLLDSVTNEFSSYLLEQNFKQIVIDSSIKYAKIIADSILNYSKKDGYRAISNYKRYTPLWDEAHWKPTPPANMAALEPYFGTVRKFYIDSTDNYYTFLPVEYSKEKESGFYKLMNSVYTASRELTEEQKRIASFWDCNPFAMLDNGHLQIGIKKISPGAHWMGIAANAAISNKLSFDSTILMNMQLATSMMDAFITCWDLKYKINRVRPETVIRKIIDNKWQPLLQSPPFPEYPSGHSTISSCSAEILSHFFGDNFSFSDSVELKYGLPVRNFSSFRQAAKEAGISRYYGGIHFMDAVENGATVGVQIGKRILRNFQNKKL